MPTTKKVYAVRFDARIRSANPAGGSGNEDKLDVGLYNSGVFRALIQTYLPDATAERIRRITKAELLFRKSSPPEHISEGGSPRVLTRRAGAAWAEGNGKVIGSNGGGVTWANQPGSFSSGQTDTVVPAGAGVLRINVVGQVRAMMPTSVEGGGGATNFGFMLLSFDEGSTARTFELWSQEAPVAADRPSLEITWETNTAPGAPIDLAPATNTDGSAVIAPKFAGSASFGGSVVDTDPGDYITAVQTQIFVDSATDATPGSALLDQTFTDFAGSPTTWQRQIAIDSLTVGTAYRARHRTRDREFEWGAWSSLTASRFIPNTPPGAPTNLAVDPASLSPNFFGSLDDPDPGAAIGTVSIDVFQDTAQGAVAKWQGIAIVSGGTRFQIPFGGGQTMEFGVQYRWRAQITDNLGSTGPWSAWQYWTPQEVFGANNMSPRSVVTKQSTVYPTLTIAHSAPFDAYLLQVARYADGSELLWDVPLTVVPSTTSVSVPWTAGSPGVIKPLDWGKTYYWRTKIRVGGVTLSDWGPWFPFYVNALPRKPIVRLSDGIDNALTGGVEGYAIDSGKGYLVTTTTTPIIYSPFSDPDLDKGYVEAEGAKFISIYDVTAGAPVAAYWTGGASYSAPVGDTHTVSPPLTMEHLYGTAVIVRDNAGQYSPWSDGTRFKVSAPPTATLATAIDTTDPSPTIDWTYASTPDKGQQRFRVRVYANLSGALIHDSGLVESAVTDYVVPGGLLADATAYRAVVTVYDTDLLWGSLAVTPWTTAFTTPAALTGLVATPDLDSSAINLAWDVTALSNAHFWRYRIYRRNLESDGFDLIGEVASKTTLVFVDKEAPHRVTADYAVTVSNGWAESDIARVTAFLDLEWWMVTPTDESLTFPIPYSDGLRDREEYDQETFRPLGRRFPLVVSGELLAPAGMVTLKILPGDPDRIRSKIRRASAVRPWVVLKSPVGDVLRVALGSTDRDLDVYDTQVLTFNYQTVA